MKYLFGPVNSRRLGLSLGIDLVPAKTCNFNCIYCEVGETTQLTCERKEYAPTSAILDEIDELIEKDDGRAIDVFTITGSGEPTLHKGIGLIIRHLKERSEKPVAVLTNGSLFHLKDVRNDLREADIVIPSLDAARLTSFRRINRPAPCVNLDDVIHGLYAFSREFTGQLWLEILLAKGINDGPDDIAALQEAVKKIGPGKIQLNTVARPPLEDFAVPLNRERIEEVAGQLARNFNGQVEILVHFEGKSRENSNPIVESDIVQMLKRRPCTATDVCAALNLEVQPVMKFLQDLEQTGKARAVIHDGRKYYQVDMSNNIFPDKNFE